MGNPSLRLSEVLLLNKQVHFSSQMVQLSCNSENSVGPEQTTPNLVIPGLGHLCFLIYPCNLKNVSTHLQQTPEYSTVSDALFC